LSATGPLLSNICRIGNRQPTKKRDFIKTASKFLPTQPTSPVEAISTTRIGSGPIEASEGKLRRFHAHVIELKYGRILFLHRAVHNDTCSDINKIYFENLLGERKGTRCHEIAFYHHHIVIPYYVIEY